MTLTLQIENHDALETGGPVWLTLERKGASIGRRGSMDWVLPDPTRLISGHHFDIGYRDGAYWLTDVSMNGTFLQGQRHRLEGAYRLQGGERLIVGHYIIAVILADQHMPPQPPAPDVAMGWDNPGTSGGDDPWDFDAPALQPIDPLPQVTGGGRHHFDEMAQDFIPLQRPPQPHLPSEMPAGAPMPPPMAAPPQQFGQPPQFPEQAPPPVAMPPANPAPNSFYSPPPPAMQPPAAPPPATTAEPVASDGVPAEADFLRAFCEGAGLNPAVVNGPRSEALAQELGRLVRIAAQELMRMLQDRANVKQFTRGGERTMRSATGNNPLKFLPDPDQALEALFLNPRDGFMTGADGFENALKDLRRHQMAVFAALQPALAEVLTGLSPDEVEAAAESGGKILGGSKRGRNWDLYVERWDDKAKTGDHGMLDVFLRAFATAYAEATARGGDSNPF